MIFTSVIFTSSKIQSYFLSSLVPNDRSSMSICCDLSMYEVTMCRQAFRYDVALFLVSNRSEFSERLFLLRGCWFVMYYACTDNSECGYIVLYTNFLNIQKYTTTCRLLTGAVWKPFQIVLLINCAHSYSCNERNGGRKPMGKFVSQQFFLPLHVWNDPVLSSGLRELARKFKRPISKGVDTAISGQSRQGRLVKIY